MCPWLTCQSWHLYIIFNEPKFIQNSFTLISSFFPALFEFINSFIHSFCINGDWIQDFDYAKDLTLSCVHSLFKIFFKDWYMNLCAGIHRSVLAPKASDPSAPGVTRQSWAALHWCWETISCLLQEQHMLLTSALSPELPHPHPLWNRISLRCLTRPWTCSAAQVDRVTFLSQSPL